MSFRQFIRDFVAFDAQLTQSIEDNYRYIGEPNRYELYVRLIMCFIYIFLILIREGNPNILWVLFIVPCSEL
jgi:hypothetical protein